MRPNQKAGMSHIILQLLFEFNSSHYLLDFRSFILLLVRFWHKIESKSSEIYFYSKPM